MTINLADGPFFLDKNEQILAYLFFYESSIKIKRSFRIININFLFFYS